MANRTCCFCIDLRIGCFIIAYLTLVHRAITLGLQIFNTAYVYSLVDSYLTYIIMFVTSFAFIRSFYVILTIVLVIGLHKNKGTLVKIFLIATGVVFIIDLLLGYITIMKFAEHYRLYDWSFVALGFFENCIYVCFYCVLRSYYLVITSRKQNMELNAQSYHA